MTCPNPFYIWDPSIDTFVYTPNGGGGTGTVTSVGVATANGVSGTVANPTTTPSISLALGAISPTSITAAGSITSATDINAPNGIIFGGLVLTNKEYLINASTMFSTIIQSGDNSATSDRNLFVSLSNADRTLTLTGNSTINQDVSTAGTPSFSGVNISSDNSLFFANQTSASAAFAGTLLNAPSSGNPLFWLRFKVNGVNVGIPCWSIT